MTVSTNFPKFDENFPKWIGYFHAGIQWFETYNLLHRKNIEAADGYWMFFVEPYALFFSIELFVKSIVSKHHPEFNPKSLTRGGNRMSHFVTNIIEQHIELPILKSIYDDKDTYEVIKAYEKTIDTRFGETQVFYNNDEAKKLSDLANRLAEEIDSMRKLT